MENYWVLGSTFRKPNQDQKDRFLAEGIWEIQNPSESDRQLVRAMQPGDKVAIKSTFVKWYKLPFENNEQPVSVLRIKARGTILENPGDGERVLVEWDKGFTNREWYFYTYQKTIWQLREDEEAAKQLKRFIFLDESQNYSWFLSHPFWHDKYARREEPMNERAIWIEKTLVRGRPDREGGENALGKALWSPQKSKSGGDIYSSMRKVKPGDLVLHLTDNEAFTGISLAKESADDTFEGIAGTDWTGKCYRIPLDGYQAIDPPLHRDQLLKTEPFAAELKELIEGGARGVFFNSNLELNQGKYLTEASPTLVSILKRAYLNAAGKPLPMLRNLVAPESESSTGAEPFSLMDALESIFLDQEEMDEILLLWKAKKNIILQGPPGVGKSFAAEKLAFALMEEAERERIGFVQFHQSYSYEDFVEGYKPVENGFELKSGKFVQFCRKAEEDQKNRYVYVIDEINRGNLSKILGELMLLVEGDKRSPNWAIPLASGKLPFYVPPNVYLMGLMNTADRSLAVVDYALRRRFAFIELKPKLSSEKFQRHLSANGISDEVISLVVERIEALNYEIVSDTLNLGPGFAIGHSFFCEKPLSSETDKAWYRRVIKSEIAPLIKEYWFDAPQRAEDWEARLLQSI